MKKMNKRQIVIIAAVLSINIQSVWAQSDTPQTDTTDTQEMDHSNMQGMDHSKMKGMDHSNMQGMDHSKMKGMDHGNMQGMDMGSMNMQGGSAPHDARDPHAHSGGYDFGDVPRPRFADEHNFGMLLMDRFEVADTPENSTVVYDLQAWYGRDYERVVIKAEGDYSNSSLEEASTELLWSHAVASYWDSQLGVRYDSGEGPNRGWLAFGLQGLAPYWFELDMTAYIGDSGRSAINLEAEYELLFTQKLIFQPRLEADFYGKNDIQRGIGSGLSSVSAGLRLRYEFRREIAPYLGFEWTRKFGRTADYAQIAGTDPKDARVVAGMRFWF